jgi:diaminopimelate decarboxylase
MLGGEMVEYCYLPLINLTRPSMTEHPCLITGSLCTPRDRWGFSYFGSDLQCGDLLLIPNTGAYSYSLRQQFIKPLPRTLFISADYGKQNRKVEVSV